MIAVPCWKTMTRTADSIPCSGPITPTPDRGN
jgi:hypothetical protein